MALSSDTVPGRLRLQARESPGKVFLRSTRGEIDYEEFEHRVDCLARSLSELGVGKGDTVALVLRNTPDFLFAWFAVSRLGAIHVSVNFKLTGELLRHQVSSCRCETVIAEADFVPAIEAIRDQLPDMRQLIVVAPEGEEIDGDGDVHDFRELLAAERRLADDHVQLGPLDPTVVIFTSGTTGPSKGVVNSHWVWMRQGLDSCAAAGIAPDDVHYVYLPLYHGNAQMMGVMSALVSGGTVALGERFSASRFWDEVRRFEATCFYFVGTVLVLLMKQEASPLDRDNPIRVAIGGGTPAQLFADFTSRFDLSIIECYGQVEAGGVVTTNRIDDIRPGSLGREREGYEVRIFDSEDRELPAGEVGEIVVRPLPGTSISDGYFGLPQETLAARRNLWLHTGDRGRYDEDGYLWFVDRAKDNIRKGGVNISSYELEVIFNAHPQVLESAVFPVDDEISQEAIKLVVVPREGEDLDVVELHAWAQEQLPEFMVPRFYEVREGFEKTASERVEKYKLKQEGIGSAWDAAAA